MVLEDDVVYAVETKVRLCGRQKSLKQKKITCFGPERLQR